MCPLTLMKKTPMVINDKAKIKNFLSIPNIKIVKGVNIMAGEESTVISQHANPHINMHGPRVYLLNSAILKTLGIKNITEARNYRIASISKPTDTDVQLFGPNFFINQYLSEDINDRERIISNYGKMMRMVHYREEQYNEDCIKYVYENCCHCKQEDDLCEHILKFNPEVLLLPHSGYYLNKKFLTNVVRRGIVIIGTAHVCDEYVMGSKIVEQIDEVVTFGKKYNKEGKYDYEYKNIKQERTVAEWERRHGKIFFDVKDDKMYHHDNFLNFLYYQNNFQYQETLYTVSAQVEYEGMKHLSYTIKGTENAKAVLGLPVNELEKLIIKNSCPDYILGLESNITTAVDKINQNKVFIVEDKRNTDKVTYMVRNVKNNLEFSLFRTKEPTFVNAIRRWWFKKDRNAVNFDYDFEAFKLEYQATTIQISNSLYMDLLASAMGIVEKNKKNLESFFRKAIIMLATTTNKILTVYQVLKSIVRDLFIVQLCIVDLMNDPILKNLDQIKAENDFTFKEKVYDFFFGSTKLNDELKKINDKEMEEMYKKMEKGKKNDEIAEGMRKAMNQTINTVYLNMPKFDLKEEIAKLPSLPRLNKEDKRARQDEIEMRKIEQIVFEGKK